MGDVPQARRRRGPIPLGIAGRCEGRAAGRTGSQEMEAAQMDPHPETESLSLPVEGGGIERYRLRGPRAFAKPSKPFTRVAYAAAHVVADPRSAKDPWLEAAIDWDATLAYRRHLWSWGFGVAEAMDTAQRGMGLDWKNSLELIQRSIQVSDKGNLIAGG